MSPAGVIVYGIDGTGKHVRASGWGPAFMDEGSGYDIGELSIPSEICEISIRACTWFRHGDSSMVIFVDMVQVTGDSLPLPEQRMDEVQSQHSAALFAPQLAASYRNT